IGRGIELLPYFIVAFQEFGKTGIGRGRGRFKLARAYATTRVRNGGQRTGNVSLPQPQAAEDGRESVDRPLVFDGKTNKVYMQDAVVGWEDIRAASDQLLEQLGNTGAHDTPRHICNSPVDPLLSMTSIAKSCDSPFEHGLQSKTNQTHAESAASSHALHLTVSFETMTRLKFEGSLNDRPEFHVLIRSLLRRISSLLYFHHGTKLDMDFRGFISQAERVRLAAQRTQWVDWERYSSRQDARMKLGGIVGAATYEFPDPDLVALFLPWLLLGEYAHVGKGGTFGLGRFTVSLG
ncbi:MAG: CRISPR system precrRNA processing endoribonuclease RAMP protein Cas6, partial [Bacillota bacterium]